MLPYEKPHAELISFESENIMTSIGPGLPDISSGVEDLE
jgi:hypothetical protein